MVGNVNGPTPSEFSFGRGSRPSMGLYPQPNEKLDPLALKRAQLQTDTTDANAPLDFTGDYRGTDDFGRTLPGLRDRGHAPIVRESGRGEADDRIDPLNPVDYTEHQSKEGFGPAPDWRGHDPNEAWRNGEVSDPGRLGWEEGQFDPEVNAKTVAARQGSDPYLVGISNMRSELTKKRRIVKRVGGPKSVLPYKGEVDPREKP